MASKPNKPFEILAIRYDGQNRNTAVFSINDTPGEWIDQYADTIIWHEFTVYGLPDAEDVLDQVYEGDFSAAVQIGAISGYHVPVSLIDNLSAEPYTVCDAENADLEAMYSVVQECEDIQDFINDIFYIHEIELTPEYQGFGYETILLLQLPAVIVKALRVFPDLLMYFPQPTQSDEPERDLEAEAILAHRLEYSTPMILKGDTGDNVSFFPPKHPVPEREANRFLGRRNPGDIVPIAYRDQNLYRLYRAAGFEDAGQTGWLYKRIHSIYTEDGLNS